MMTKSQVTLPGYHLAEQLYKGSRTLVYRGTRDTDGKPVIIKILRNEYPTFSELIQFRNQHTIAKNLDVPGIVKPLALVPYRNGYALVMPDEGDISLPSSEAQGRQVSIPEFLNIGIQLADILHGLHQNRVIHKDIKPANILIHPQTKQVKLIDFSISSLLPKETQEIQNPNILEGTLAYISPEQTGRMNRGIDYRTDFYSLGVTFHELLTGELPFQSNDPMELVHAHIAKMVPSLGNSAPVPQVISDIVMKLMAKNVEDRYQNALGLKYDLEQCLSQWTGTGTIERFELGQRDVRDRFIIPEKLYGREDEVTQLLAAFDRVANGNTELMLVSGFSGIGKTAVINEVHKPIVRQRGYFIKGKFDQFNRNIPFSAFVQAFRDLMGQLLSESDAQLQQWKDKILSALGENAQVIIEVIPELERIVGQQPPVPELTGNAAQNRFNLLLGKFVRVFTTIEHPLVLFLDDLQWADSASLSLMKLLMEQLEVGYLLVLGAYRDNEVFPAHPLMLTLDEIQKQGANSNILTLAPLDKSNITRLVADTLLCSVKLAAPLSQLIYQKTRGNPFFTTQFLQGLHEENCITFEGNAGCWQCDLAQVRQLALTDDVVEFMVGRLRKLPAETQKVLKLAACIGNRFDLGTLAVVCECSQDKVATDLWRGLQENFVIPESQTYKFFQGDDFDQNRGGDVGVDYRFLHDRVQQAAYALLPESERASVHFSIGQLLLSHLSLEQRNKRIFEVVNHLNYGIHLISNPTEKHELLNLNLLAGQQAHSSTAYASALEYFLTGLNLLGKDTWTQHYDLSKSIHIDVAKNAYLSGDLPQMETFLKTAFAQTGTLLDKIPLYEIKIQALASQHQLQEAIELGLDILQQLGLDFPEQPTPEDFAKGLQEVNTNLAGRPVQELILLPKMEDPVALAATLILLRLSAALMIAAPHLMPFAFFKMVSLSICKGNTAMSALGYATYGLILCSAVGDIDTGYQFGKLAVQVLEKFSGKGVQATTMTRINAGVSHWKESLRSTLPSLQETYQVALETGDLEYTAVSAQVYAYHLYFSGQELSQVARELAAYSHAIVQIQHKTFLYCVKAYHQHTLNLLGRSADPIKLIGTAYDETIDLPHQYEANDAHGIAVAHLFKGIGCYFFSAYDDALDNFEKITPFLRSISAFATGCALTFYESLTRLATIDRHLTTEQTHSLEKVVANQEKLAHWANHAPMNYLHRYHLVEAEKHRVLGEKLEAIEMYDRAISGAKQHEYLQEEALANELAAKFYLNWGKDSIAEAYLQKAYYGYARWGAKAKTDHLEVNYPQLLAPILQQPKSPLLLNATTTLTSNQTVRTSSTATTSLLDISATVKASQALSGEIELEALLSQLMQIVLENAGADKGVLILNNSRTWEVVTQCGEKTCQLSPTLLENADTFPVSLVRVVQRTQETIILNQVETDARFARDSYLIEQQPQSLFCTPILNQGQLIGILYLENKFSRGAFTQDRVEVLNLLCSQAAISIENARLYQQSQAHAQQAQDYAQQLEQSLKDLQQAQLQMVQSEKMSALGNLVAGVAHEINNPVGFIAGNLQPAQDYVQDLLNLIDLYQEKYPNSDEEIKEEIEEMDLEFVREDLPKLIGSMKEGTERIRHISTSLRTFSRTDKEHKVAFNLHEGLESTLLILKHRLKGNEERPEIEIIKEYEELSEVQCFPGQLNQVFMNLIANGIDALEESNEGRSFEEIAVNPNQITIQTEATSEGVIIRIGDNGKGMPEDVTERIFEQGFTTKGVGKGTGLGLAIARQIIEEKHKGTLTCTSERGKGTTFIINIPL
ncbi:trifunctional serine/threonine-protein kinase/ATP-binding protein/sensor histidine kinase [Lusitaniella coriacea]|uniref:trifunctional serine/threonine-protein kinase/ATP-binding protein/sensor histidine kinase n=1 Tax=Lusitaniella coriacea TaxID=1983105 RepID=UPI003CF5CF01